MAHVAEYKKKVVKEFADLIKKYPIIAALNMEDMPAPQLQKMRKQLLGKVEIKMAKKRLMRLAIEQSKGEKAGIEEIEKYFVGMPALLFTEENPFTLFKIIKKSKSKAPAKAGQISPKDIEVKAGVTPFAPGPVISELGALGLKTGVEDGKVAIKEDAIIVKEGEEIKANVAGMMMRLGIEPMEIGLDVVAVYENGTIFDKKVLDIDEDEYLNNLNQAEQWAFNLAIEAGIHNKKTVEFMLQKAYNDSKALALDQEILTDATAEIMLGKAESQAKSLKATANIPDAPVEEKKEEPKEEAPEEKKEETPAAPKAEETPAGEKPQEEESAPEEKPKEEASVEEKAQEEKSAPEEKPKEEASVEEKEEESALKEEPEKPVEEKEETPAGEKTPEPAQKEEPKEEKAPEEKKEEAPVEKEETQAKPEEEKKDTDEKVKEMVEKTKNFAEKGTPSADDLLK